LLGSAGAGLQTEHQNLTARSPIFTHTLKNIKPEYLVPNHLGGIYELIAVAAMSSSNETLNNITVAQ
jgi:hypothetical protein